MSDVALSQAVQLCYHMAAIETIGSYHRFISPDHFVSAIVRLVEVGAPGAESSPQLQAELSKVRQLFQQFGLEPRSFRKELRELLGDGDYIWQGNDQISRTPESRAAFGRAAELCGGRGMMALDCLLAALLEVPDTYTQTMLADLNLEADALQAAILREQDSISMQGIIEDEFVVDDVEPVLSETERLEVLLQLRAIAQEEPGQAALDSMVAGILSLFPVAERAGILLWKGKELVPVAFSTMDRSYVSFTLARETVVTRRSMLWQRFLSPFQAATSLEGTTSAMYAPIILNRQIFGVLYVDTTSTRSSFMRDDLKILTEIASTLGNFIHLEAEESMRRIPSVFVSYAHTDMDFVRRFANSLRRIPVSVWFDERLRSGEDWMHQLAQAIAICDSFVLVLSPDSLESSSVQWEIDQARQSGKRIFTLMYRDCDLPADLQDIQYLHIGSDYDVAVSDLSDELYQMIGY